MSVANLYAFICIETRLSCNSPPKRPTSTTLTFLIKIRISVSTVFDVLTKQSKTRKNVADLMLSSKVIHMLLMLDEEIQRLVRLVPPTDLNKYLTASTDMNKVMQGS